MLVAGRKECFALGIIARAPKPEQRLPKRLGDGTEKAEYPKRDPFREAHLLGAKGQRL